MTSQEWWILNRVPVETDHQSDGEGGAPPPPTMIALLCCNKERLLEGSCILEVL